MKKFLALLMIFALLCSALVACGDSEKKESSADTSKDESANTSNNNSSTVPSDGSENGEVVQISEIENLSEYIKLGAYKGLSVTNVELTDKFLADKRFELLLNYCNYAEDEVVDPNLVVEMADKANIDYVGKLEGVAFEGGTGKDYDLVIGSKSFIDGFETGLLGVAEGETVDLELTFPGDYHNAEMAGVTVIFTVTVNSIAKASLPELSEAFLEEKFDVRTEKEFEAYIKDKADIDAKKKMYLEAWKQVIEGSELIQIPQALLNSYINADVEYYQYYASSYGVTLEELIGINEATLRERLTANYTEQIKQELVLYSILDKEIGREISDELFNAKVEEYAESDNMTKEDFLEKYEKENINESIYWDSVIEFVFSNANLK